MSTKYEAETRDLRMLQALAAAREGRVGFASKIGEVIRDFRPSRYAMANGGRPFAAAAPSSFSADEVTRLDDCVEKACPSVGRIEIEVDGEWRFEATCFRIGGQGRLVATAGHAMSGLLQPGVVIRAALPATFSSSPAARKARVNFNPQTLGNAGPDDPARIFDLGEVRACHSRWDLMVAEVLGEADLPPPLDLEEDPDWAGAGEEGILVLGFPSREEAERHVAFAMVFDANADFGLQAAPGRLRPLPPPPLPLAPDFDPLAVCGEHDATTFRGNSGSPVISLRTGKVVGLHFGPGRYEPDDSRDVGDFNRSVNLPVALQGEERLAALMQEGADAARIAGLPSRSWSPMRPGWRSEGRGGSLESLWDRSAADAEAAPELISGVFPDRPGFADDFYRPGLRAVPARFAAPDIPAKRIRHQRASLTCTGCALAAAIELQLARGADAAAAKGRAGGKKADAPAVRMVSERMLYECARLNDEWIDGGAGGSSLSGAIRGFYQNGVCGRDDAPDTPGRWSLTRDMARAARSVTLGAYLRVPPDLHAFRAALAEVGAVLVSAHIHKGWEAPRKGEITPGQPRVGMHAFVLIGYDDKGFLLQNSWGTDWGGFKGRKGIARWSYEDWGESLIEAWVLQLAPSNPGTFDLRPRVAARAAAAGRSGPLPPPRRHSLIGHLVNVEARGFVDSGAIGAGLGALRETALYLATPEARKKYSRIAFFLHDPFLGAEDLSRIAGALIEPLKAQKVYPLHILYGLSEIRTLRLRVLDEAAQAVARYAADTEALTDFVARRTRSVTKPLWDAYLTGARSAAARGGTLWAALAALLLEDGDSPRQVSLCAVGSGALLAQALLNAGAPKHLGHEVDCGVLVAPVLTGSDRKRWPRGTRVQRLPRPRPEPGAIPGYRGDWPDLVSAAFFPEGSLVRRLPGERAASRTRPDLPATTILGAFSEHDFREALVELL